MNKVRQFIKERRKLHKLYNFSKDNIYDLTPNDSYGKHLVINGIESLLHASSSNARDALYYRHLPYKLQKLKSGDRIALAREYNVLGTHISTWCDYEAYPFLVIPSNEIDDRFFIDERGYLWDDSCNPWRSQENADNYIERVLRVFGYFDNGETNG